MDKEQTVVFVQSVLAEKGIAEAASGQAMAPYHSYALNVESLGISFDDWAEQNPHHIKSIYQHAQGYTEAVKESDATVVEEETDESIGDKVVSLGKAVDGLTEIVKALVEDDEEEAEEPSEEEKPASEEAEEEPEE